MFTEAILITLLAGAAEAAPAATPSAANPGAATSVVEKPVVEKPVVQKPVVEKSSAADDERAEESLLRAYRRELVYLEGQKRALSERRDAIRARHDTARAALEKSVADTQEETLAKELAADRLEDEVLKAGTRVDALADARDIEDNVLDQVHTLLRTMGHDDAAVATTEGEETAKALERSLLLASASIAARNSVTTRDGNFFDEEGKQRTGTIVSLGSIALFGRAHDDPGVAGPLAPLGGGALRLAGRAPDDVTALEGGRAEKLSLFLFESVEKGVEEAKVKTPLQIVEAGGAIAWVIVGLGVTALLFALVRALTLLFIGRRRARFTGEIVALVERGDRSRAAALCRARGGPFGRVLAAALRALALPRESRDDVIDEAVLATQEPIDRFGTIVLVSAAVAPLLGLLGTVTGMITTFDSITQFGTGDPRLLSGGISEALITTELGLLVAIPALLMGNLLSAWAERIHKDVERGALLVVNLADTAPAEPAVTVPTQSGPTLPVAPLARGDEGEGQWGLA
jgi:biopolymer transport protein ExbB